MDCGLLMWDQVLQDKTRVHKSYATILYHLSNKILCNGSLFFICYFFSRMDGYLEAFRDEEDSVGHLAMSAKEQQEYVTKVEQGFLKLRFLAIEAPANRWAGPCQEIIRAMQNKVIITVADESFLIKNYGYLWNKVMQEHMRNMRGRYVQVLAEFNAEELSGVQEFHPSQECKACKTGHIRKGKLSECSFSYGPHSPVGLKSTNMPLVGYKAMVIGVSSLIILPDSSHHKLLNLGVSAAEWQTCLKERIKQRIDLLDKNSHIPILVEFCRVVSLSVPQQLYKTISTLAELQREYDAPIILIMGGYKSRDGRVSEYVNGKKMVQRWEEVAKRMGQMLGLGVCTLLTQCEWLEGDTIVANDLHWSKEPLQNSHHRFTREHLRRVKRAINQIIIALNKWRVSTDQRESAVGFVPRPQVITVE